MKRIKAACILQTLIFVQKPELGLSKDEALAINRREFEQYKASLERAGTRHQITATAELDDGSVLVHVRKQYNDKADVAEYFA